MKIRNIRTGAEYTSKTIENKPHFGCFMEQMEIHKLYFYYIDGWEEVKSASFSFNEAVPFKATPVGDVIKDELIAHDMKLSELAELIGIKKAMLNYIIKGECYLIKETALLIEDALGIPASYLMNLQKQYELDCARQSNLEQPKNKDK